MSQLRNNLFNDNCVSVCTPQSTLVAQADALIYCPKNGNQTGAGVCHKSLSARGPQCSFSAAAFLLSSIPFLRLSKRKVRVRNTPHTHGIRLTLRSRLRPAPATQFAATPYHDLPFPRLMEVKTYARIQYLGRAGRRGSVRPERALPCAIRGPARRTRLIRAGRRQRRTPDCRRRRWTAVDGSVADDADADTATGSGARSLCSHRVMMVVWY